MYKLTRSRIRKIWQSMIVILVVSVVVSSSIYIYCYPYGSSGPNRFEKARMEKMLYEIDKIVLTNKNNNNQQVLIDMNKFQELIPSAEFKGLLIVKGARVPAIAVLKDGKNVNVLMATLYPVLYYDVGNSTYKGFGNGFEFTGNGAEKYIELIEELSLQ